MQRSGDRRTRVATKPVAVGVGGGGGAQPGEGGGAVAAQHGGRRRRDARAAPVDLQAAGQERHRAGAQQGKSRMGAGLHARLDGVDWRRGYGCNRPS